MKLNTTEKNNDYEKIAYQLFRISIYIARRVDGIRAVGDRHVSSRLAGHGKLFQHNGFNGATGTHHQHDWPRRRTAHFRSAERQIRPPSASSGLDAVFIVSTLLCIYSPNIETFIALRLLQGIAGAGGIVISRSVATDMFSGKELAKSMAIIGAINGVAPVAAPVLGGFFTDIIGWRGIFWILLGIGILLLMAVVRFRESLKPENRKQEGLKQMFLGFPTMLHNRRYVYFVLQYGFSSGVLFANIASSPFIMQQHYGFSPMMFSIVFGVNSLAIGIAAASSVKFHNTESGTFIGSLGMLMFSALLLFALWLECSFWVYELLLLAVIFMLGLTFTSSTTLAMDSGRENSGTASALFGAVGFAFGGIVSPLVGIGNILTTTGIVFVVCSLFAVFFAVKAVRTSVGMRASLRPLKHLTKHK